MDKFTQITAFFRPKPGANTFVHGRKATVYAWKTNDLLKRTFSMKLTTKEKKRKCTLYVCKQSGNRLVISANVGLIKGFSFQHNHIISYLQITEANIYILFKVATYSYSFWGVIYFSTSSPGRFSLALEMGRTSKAREKRPRDEVVNFWELSFPFSAALDSFQRSIKIFSSASDHGVLRIWRPFTTRLRIWRVRARRIHT